MYKLNLKKKNLSIYIYIQLRYNSFEVINSLNLPDSITSTHSHPLRNRSVLLQLFRKLSLDDKCLMC